MARLFGTDGVRGEANVTLLPEMAYRLGRAATLYFGKEDEQPLILIGRDTRISGEMFEAALTAGICSAGGRAMLAGVIPTPAIAYLARRHKAKAGIVISASHNPFHDNRSRTSLRPSCTSLRRTTRSRVRPARKSATSSIARTF